MKKLLIVALFILAACSPQSQGWFDASYSNKVAELPSDICIKNGVPVVYGVSTESDGAVAIIYLRDDGAVTVKHYPLTLIGTDWKEGGEFYWTGGECNAE